MEVEVREVEVEVMEVELKVVLSYARMLYREIRVGTMGHRGTYENLSITASERDSN